MAKYAEGTVSPSGKFIVKNGDWVPVSGDAGPPDARPVGYTTAETLHRDPQGHTLSFPHQAAPADAEGQGYAASALALGAAPAVASLSPAAGAVLSSPTTGAVVGGVEGYRHGGLEGAVIGAGTGYLGMGALGEKLKMLKFVARLGGAKGAAAAEELAGLASQAAPVAASAAPAAEAAPMAARAAAVGLPEVQAAKTFSPGAESMKDIAAKVISWRKDMGLSKGQIASALKEHYKIPLSVGAKIANQVISGLE